MRKLTCYSVSHNHPEAEASSHTSLPSGPTAAPEDVFKKSPSKNTIAVSHTSCYLQLGVKQKDKPKYVMNPKLMDQLFSELLVYIPRVKFNPQKSTCSLHRNNYKHQAGENSCSQSFLCIDIWPLFPPGFIFWMASFGLVLFIQWNFISSHTPSRDPEWNTHCGAQ